MKSNYGVETVDSFTQEPDQRWKDFIKYVRQMVSEYHLAGMNVYTSHRATKDYYTK